LLCSPVPFPPHVQPGDHILEVGFGPGMAIQQIAGIAVDGFVAGIDPSETMVKQASKRNATAVREGRVDLKQGTVAALPHDDNAFDKVFAVNSLHHWPNPAENLKELHRVLKPGGLIAITEQPRSTWSEEKEQENRAKLSALLSGAGFSQIRLKYKSMKRAPSVCALGVK